MQTLRGYFANENKQRSALEALGKDEWFNPAELDLYNACRHAYDPLSSEEAASESFLYIYGELSGPNWSVWRGRTPGHWPPKQIFETIKREFAQYPWDGTVNLLNLGPATISQLELCLLKMREIKSNKGYPIMAVSKFLHFYNPALFPIYDTAVMWNKVCNGCFKRDLRSFWKAEGLPYNLLTGEDTLDFLLGYMRWASSLLSAAHNRFMQVFAQWLATQPGVEMSKQRFDAATLYARAFEYTATGAALCESPERS